ncbi:hypothetical protein [Burkholderia ubonensis]|uniref:hypothetical protein n=1 Tax=Burkholderia ubonensis TaxID=101571 RepID=UPI000A7E820C|nr:hypothetical protein [Burkholderia ubonensis]
METNKQALRELVIKHRRAVAAYYMADSHRAPADEIAALRTTMELAERKLLEAIGVAA